MKKEKPIFYHRGNELMIDIIKSMAGVPKEIEMCNGLIYNGYIFFPYPTFNNHRIEINDVCRRRKLTKEG